MGIAEDLVDARQRTLALVDDLDDSQWMPPRIDIINNALWEVGHIGWFQEKWVLGSAKERDVLYDSARVAHETRWTLPLPSRAATFAYVRDVLSRSLEAVRRGADPYFPTLALFHEDMHGEALFYTRQTLSYAPPKLGTEAPPAGPCEGDAAVPGGTYWLGARQGHDAFVFDNEKWAHPVTLAPFCIARAPVTNAELLRFVEDGGYSRRELWSDEGWAWRSRAGAEHPVYWKPTRFEVRHFDRWVPLEPHAPAIHVAWFEAEAYCRWAKRRLPTEAEWELAASGLEKRRFPWGDAPPTDEHAALDARLSSPADVGAFPAGDSPFGCRQMLGNVWEWTASDFEPFPGFVIDPYAEYSEPWFHSTHKVLRGGCFATRARLLRNTWRNFYPPHRRDVLAGFRTCAL